MNTDTTTSARPARYPRRRTDDSYLARLLTEGTFPGLAAPGGRDPTPAPVQVGADQDTAEAAAALVTVRARSSSGHTDPQAAQAAAAWAEDCITACTAAGCDPLSAEPADWAGFGTVIPVLGASPGAGASVLCAALADAAAGLGHRVLLVDAADPLRSGLRNAADTDATLLEGPHPAVGVRQGRRGPIRTACAEFTGVPVRSAGMIPPPVFWVPPDADTDLGVDVTVVDLGWDAWTLAAHPLRGPGAWLRTGTPPPSPVLAVAPSGPGARAAEQLLERLGPWCTHGGVSAPVAVAVMRARRVPGMVAAAAGHRLDALLSACAVAVPEDRVLAEHGVRAEPTPARVQQAVAPLLADVSPPHPMPASTGVSRTPRRRRTASRTPERTPS